MRRRLFALFALGALTLAAAGCGDWGAEDITFFLDEIAAEYPIPEAGQPLSESSDQAVQAAGKTPEAIKKEREAQRLVSEAIQSRSPELVTEARQLLPHDITLRFDQTALLIALDHESAAHQSLAEIRGLIYDDSDTLADATYSEFVGTSLFLQSLGRAMGGFNPGSPEWTRLNDAYCLNLITYLALSQAFEQELGARAAADRFSAVTCP